jgi:hypothetical protein
MGQNCQKNKKHKSPLLPGLSNDGKAPMHPRERSENLAHRWSLHIQQAAPPPRNEAAHLQAINIKTISHLYETNDLGNLQKIPNTAIDRQLIDNPELIEKLQLLRQALNRMHLPFSNKRQVEEAAVVTTARRRQPELSLQKNK